jgi:hypothetical protein
MSTTPATQPAIVLAGLDEDDKPRAAKFSGAHRDLVLKAAGLMKLDAYELEPAAMKLDPVIKLPAGKLYSNGRGFVPSIRHDQYSKLLVALGVADPSRRAAEREGIVLKGYPADWRSIAVGHLVLVQCDDPKDGWCEALVLKTDNNTLTVKWRDYPRYAPFARNRNAVALLNPALTPGQ